MKAVILHGSIGHPFENWFPWLGKKLTEEFGWQVRAPQLPTPEGQNRTNWLKHLERQAGDFIDEQTVIIGHSCGMLLMLNYLQEISFSVAGSISVSAPFGEVVVEEFKALDRTFYEVGFDWDKIKHNAGKVGIFHGDDDPYVPLTNSQNLAEKLGGKVEVIAKGGHLNSKAGFDEFPALYSFIEKNWPKEP